MIVGKFGEVKFYGTGCLIGPNIVLTCAHNIYHKKWQIKARELKFVPRLHGENGKAFEVKSSFYLDEYINEKKVR